MPRPDFMMAAARRSAHSAEELEKLYDTMRCEYTMYRNGRWYWLKWLGLGVPKEQWPYTTDFSFRGMSADQSWREFIVRSLHCCCERRTFDPWELMLPAEEYRRLEFVRRRERDRGFSHVYCRPCRLLRGNVR